ncbi:hypothetical protein TNCV_1107021 [Trichonephila clavipes]|nr:hypothetical protein TNCV_1107021 [Trichonephila clavipes]
MSTFNIPILPFFVHIFLKTTQLSCRKKNNSTRSLNSKIKANTGEKQLNSSVGTKQLNSTGENNSTRQHERNYSTGENNSTQQQERTTQLGSRNETTQLVSRNETTQLCTAVDRLQPPAPPTTACTAFTAKSAFSTYSRPFFCGTKSESRHGIWKIKKMKWRVKAINAVVLVVHDVKIKEKDKHCGIV